MISNAFNPAIHMRVGELAIDQEFTYSGVKYRIIGHSRSTRSSRTNGTVQVYNYSLKRSHCLAKRSIINRADVVQNALVDAVLDIVIEKAKAQQQPKRNHSRYE